MVLILLAISVIQLLNAIKERKALTKLRIAKFVTFSILFLLTFFRSTNLVIEKIDWVILENKRAEIVRQVKDKKLNPNVSWNNWVCELPFNFPIVSHGGNDIGIKRNEDAKTTTVTFWVFRNYFDSPSTLFIYTDDKKKIKALERKIKDNPGDNWKIKENWYRTYNY